MVRLHRPSLLLCLAVSLFPGVFLLASPSSDVVVASSRAQDNKEGASFSSTQSSATKTDSSSPSSESSESSSNARSSGSASKEKQVLPLQDLSPREVFDVLKSWNLDGLATCLALESVDGEVLHHFEPGDFDETVQDCNNNNNNNNNKVDATSSSGLSQSLQIRKFHLKKLQRRLDEVRRNGGVVELVVVPEESESQPPTRAGLLPGRAVLEESPATATATTTTTRRGRRQLGSSAEAISSGLAIRSNQSFVSFGTEHDVKLYRSGPGELTLDGDLKLPSVMALEAEVARLTELVDSIRANVTTLQSHDYVYTWFEDGWFTLPAHHYSNGFDTVTHQIASIECSSDTRGMMFYDVSGYEDGICICTGSNSGSATTYLWYDVISASWGDEYSCN